MLKFDLKREYKSFFNPPRHRYVEVILPSMSFVKVDGSGDPNTAIAYRNAVEWLYSVSYALKFAAKSDLGINYVVPPLEALWWSDDPGSFIRREKDRWRWTVMILAPHFITDTMFNDAVEKILKRREDIPTSLRYEPYTEGRSLQTLHVGSYDDEGPILKLLHDTLMPELGVTFHGPHHEIYLSDPRKTAPDRLKTILRQPIHDL
jgi:hypothetical protein